MLPNVVCLSNLICQIGLFVIGFFQEIAQFFITNGIPQGLHEKVLDLLAAPPNLMHLLESCPFSNGSCEGLLRHIESSSTDGTAVSLFKELVEKV